MRFASALEWCVLRARRDCAGSVRSAPVTRDGVGLGFRVVALQTQPRESTSTSDDGERNDINVDISILPGM